MCGNGRTVCTVHEHHEDKLEPNQHPNDWGQPTLSSNRIEYGEECINNRELGHPNDKHSLRAQNVGDFSEEEALKNAIQDPIAPHYETNGCWSHSKSSKCNWGSKKQRLNGGESNLE